VLFYLPNQIVCLPRIVYCENDFREIGNRRSRGMTLIRFLPFNFCLTCVRLAAEEILFLIQTCTRLLNE